MTENSELFFKRRFLVGYRTAVRQKDRIGPIGPARRYPAVLPAPTFPATLTGFANTLILLLTKSARLL